MMRVYTLWACPCFQSLTHSQIKEAMSRRGRSQDFTPTYCRAYLVTLGLVFVMGVGGLLWILDTGTADGGGWGMVLMAGAGALGIGLLLAGLLGPSHRMEAWADAAATHEASLIVMVLAYPVYLVLRLFYDTRRS